MAASTLLEVLFPTVFGTSSTTRSNAPSTIVPEATDDRSTSDIEFDSALDIIETQVSQRNDHAPSSNMFNKGLTYHRLTYHNHCYKIRYIESHKEHCVRQAPKEGDDSRHIGYCRRPTIPSEKSWCT
jgi:hypothetical protein